MHGFGLIENDDESLPHVAFGGGNILISSGWKTDDGTFGLLLSETYDNLEPGTIIKDKQSIFTGIENKKSL